jgi:hypothetical protein
LEPALPASPAAPAAPAAEPVDPLRFAVLRFLAGPWRYTDRGGWSAEALRDLAARLGREREAVGSLPSAARRAAQRSSCPLHAAAAAAFADWGECVARAVGEAEASARALADIIAEAEAARAEPRSLETDADRRFRERMERSDARRREREARERPSRVAAELAEARRLLAACRPERYRFERVYRKRRERLASRVARLEAEAAALGVPVPPAEPGR